MMRYVPPYKKYLWLNLTFNFISAFFNVFLHCHHHSFAEDYIRDFGKSIWHYSFKGIHGQF